MIWYDMTLNFPLISFDDDSKMTTTDSCSYYTPGSINGWHSPDTSSTSFHNGAISKNNINYAQQNGYRESQNGREEKNGYKESHKSEREEERLSRSPKNINLSNGLKNVNISNGVIPKTKKSKSRENSKESVNGDDRKCKFSFWPFLQHKTI